MSGNEAKFYLWLQLTAYFSGPNRGCVEASYEDMARANGFSSRTLQRVIEGLERKPYIEVERAANQHELTRIKILKYDLADPNSAVDKPDHSNSDGVDSAVDSGVDKFDRSAVHSNVPMSLEREGLQALKNAVEVKKEKKGTADAVRRRFDAELPIANSDSSTAKPNPSSKRSEKLRARLAEKIGLADDRYASYIAWCLKRGESHPFGDDEQDAFRALGYKPDLSSDHLSSCFVMSVLHIYEEHRDKGVTPGNMCSKVLDYCQSNRKKDITLGGSGDGYYWPPDFQEHRNRLRERERQKESISASQKQAFSSPTLSSKSNAGVGGTKTVPPGTLDRLPRLEPVRR
jgi:hypothetical protein